MFQRICLKYINFYIYLLIYVLYILKYINFQYIFFTLIFQSILLNGKNVSSWDIQLEMHHLETNDHFNK